MRRTGAKLNQPLSMNKVSQSQSSKMQSDYNCALHHWFLTPMATVNLNQQSLCEFRALLKHTSLYSECNTDCQCHRMSLGAMYTRQDHLPHTATSFAPTPEVPVDMEHFDITVSSLILEVQTLGSGWAVALLARIFCSWFSFKASPPFLLQ